MKNKRGLEFETIGKWIIALLLLALVVMGYVILKGKGSNIFENLKNLFIFWR
ncbi:hypothetical protein HZA33_02180 [Candidatus Pacearchaeota archaeon]|nr:hypothetical protein [Candidatus Pacearchaeota archaeon]